MDELEPLAEHLADRYEILEPIGNGGMATVHRARDVRHDRFVALKVIRSEYLSVIGRERFIREIAIISKLSHPNIVALYDSGTTNGIPFYVMPLVEGPTLRSYLAGRGPLSVEESIGFVKDIAGALDYAASHGIVHRDVKPENIFVSHGRALLSDFGLAAPEGQSQRERLTSLGAAVGTPSYMSPEQCRGAANLDPSSDVYSLGCVAYELLAGTPPFSAPTPAAMQARHMFEPAPRLRTVRPDLAAASESSVMRALEKDPRARFKSCGEFARALSGVGAAASESAPTLELPTPRKRNEQAKTALVPALISGVLLVALLSWMGVRFLKQREAAPSTRAWVLIAEMASSRENAETASALRQLLVASLSQSRRVHLLDEDQTRLGLQAAGLPESTRVTDTVARQIAVRGEVPALVSSRLERAGRAYVISAQLVDSKTGRTLWRTSTTSPTDRSLPQTVEKLGHSLRNALGEHTEMMSSDVRLTYLISPDFAAITDYQRATELAAIGDHLGARHELYSALGRDPHFAQAWLSLRSVYSWINEPDSMKFALDSALAHPDRLAPSALAALEVRRELSDGQFEAALGKVERAAYLFPDDDDLITLRGTALAAFGRWGESAAVLESLVLTRPFGPTDEELSNLFLALSRSGRHEDARRYASTIRSWIRLSCLGSIALQQLKLEEADSCATALITASGGNPLARRQGLVFRASLTALRGSASDAARELSSLSTDQWQRSAILLTLAAGMDISAPRSRVEGNRKAALLTRALYQAAIGDARKAEACLDTLRLHHELDGTAQVGAGRDVVHGILLLRQGSPDQALRLVRPWTTLGTEIGALGGADLIGAAWTYYVAAAAFESMGMADSAGVLYERMAMMTPSNREVASTRGLTRVTALCLAAKARIRCQQLAEAIVDLNAIKATATTPDPRLRATIREIEAGIASLRPVIGGQ